MNVVANDLMCNFIGVSDVAIVRVLYLYGIKFKQASKTNKQMFKLINDAIKNQQKPGSEISILERHVKDDLTTYHKPTTLLEIAEPVIHRMNLNTT